MSEKYEGYGGWCELHGNSMPCIGCGTSGKPLTTNSFNAELTALRALCESLTRQRDEALGTVSLLKELNETLRGERDRENAELITASAQLSEALAVIARAVEWAEESVICRSEEADFGWHGACHGVLSILRGTNAQS